MVSLLKHVLTVVNTVTFVYCLSFFVEGDGVGGSDEQYGKHS